MIQFITTKYEKIKKNIKETDASGLFIVKIIERKINRWVELKRSIGDFKWVVSRQIN